MAAALEILHEEGRKKDETIVQLDHQIKRQEVTIGRMQEQLEDLLRRMYGRRSEKLDINQMLMDGLILDANGEGAAPELPPEEDVPVKPRAKRKQ